METSEELKLVMLTQVNNALVDVFNTTLEEISNELKYKHGEQARIRYMVCFCIDSVCKLGRDETLIIMNIKRRTYDNYIKHFMDLYSNDKEFIFRANLFVTHFKKIFSMWYNKMSKEDKERAIEIGLIKKEEPKEKPTHWKLVFMFCGSQEVICGPSRYKHCVFMRNKKKRETQYQRGEFKIIPA